MNKKQILPIFTIIMSLLLVVGCSNNNSDGKDLSNNSSANSSKNQILFNGSSTLAPVITSIASDFSDTFGTWDQVDSSLSNSEIAIYVSSGGSGQGTKAVIDKTTTFGMLAREVKDDEKAQINDPKEYLVGIDALTLSVHPENPLLTITDDLSKEEIMKIFSGEYETWQDFDSSLPDENIVVVTRDVGGGAHGVFQSKIMGDVDVKADAIQEGSMGALVTKLTENKYAIGYASFGIANQNAGKVVMLKVDGVEATAQNIQSGSYIIQRPLLLLNDGELSGEEQAFLDVILSKTGQNIVEEMGFIPAK